MQGHKTTAVCPRTRKNLMRRRCFCAWTMCFKVGGPFLLATVTRCIWLLASGCRASHETARCSDAVGVTIPASFHLPSAPCSGSRH